MAKKIKIRVFNTLESNNLMVSGWYSYKDDISKRYGLFTGTTEGLENEHQACCKEFMKPNIKISTINLCQIYIKVRHCDLVYEHEYRNWNDDICIGWLRAGNLGGDTVNWFFNGKKDCWYNGGEKGGSLVVSHRVICGNIPPSVGLGNPPYETEEKENDGHYTRPGSEGNSSASGGHYIRPGSEENNYTPQRLYPTGKGSILEKYMNEDGSPKEPKRLYPTPYGMEIKKMINLKEKPKKKIDHIISDLTPKDNKYYLNACPDILADLI